MDQKDVEQKPRGGDGKTFTLRFWMGFVLAFVVYRLVANNPLGFFAAYLRYTLIVLFSLMALGMFVRNKTNQQLMIINKLLQKFNIFFDRIKLLLMGFVLGFMIWSFVFYIIPRMKIVHMQRIHQMQQVHRNSISGDK